MRLLAVLAAAMAALFAAVSPAVAAEPLGATGPRTLDPHQLADRASLSVNVANGNLVVQANDLNIAGTGLSLGMSRTYNSLRTGSGEMGEGWMLGVSRDVQLSAAAADGSRTLTWTDGSKHVFASSSGAFVAPPELGAHLKTNGTGFDLTFDRSGVIYGFAANGDLTKVTDRNDNSVAFAYDAGGLTTATDTRAKQLAVRHSTGTGTNIDRLTDWTGRVWSYGYTGDRLTSYTDPELKGWSYGYTASGKLNRITDPRGTVTQIGYATYDGAERVASVTRVVDGTATNDVTTTYVYSAASSPCDPAVHARKTVVTDPRGNATTHCSTASGRVTAAKDAMGRDTATTYTPNGDVQKFTDTPGTGSPAVTNLNYDLGSGDATNNPTGGDGPEGEQFTIGYGSTQTNPLAKYWPTRQTDTEGKSTFYGYDPKGNLTDVKDSDTTSLNKATLEYHPNGVLKSATDGEGHRTDYAQTAGNITTITPPAPLGATTLTYDALNRVATVKDGKGQTRTMTYDKLDRVVRVDVTGGRYFAYTYDANGNVVSRKTGTDAFMAPTETTYTYDKLNRRTYEAFPGHWYEYAYDKASNLASIGGSGAVTSYTYDAVDRVKSIAEGGGVYVSYAYDDSARKVTRSYYGGAKHETTTDKSGKPTLITFRPASTDTVTQLKSLAYSYTEQVGTESKARSMIQSITREDGRKSTYEYGRVGEVTKMRRVSGTGALTRELRYTYDKALNRLSRTKEEPAGTSTTYWAYNAANQVCAQSTTAGPTCAAGTFTYDANGNRTGGAASGSWDSLDRLISLGGDPVAHNAPTNGELVESDRRTWRNNLLGLGAMETSTTTQMRFIRDPDGNPIGMRGTATGLGLGGKWFMTDHQNSVISVHDPARASTTGGAFVGDALYEPDGVTTNAADNNIGFAGGHQVKPGVYHFGRRFYDTATAQWTQPDPLEQQTDLTQANRYTYVGANGVNHTDPSGLQTCSACATGEAITRAEKQVWESPAARAIRRGIVACGVGSVFGVAGDMITTKWRFGFWLSRGAGPYALAVGCGLGVTQEALLG